MRILVLTNMFPPHAYGGYELWCEDVVRRWRQAGHDVAVLTSDHRIPDPPARRTSPVPDVEVRRVLSLYWEDHVIVRPPVRRRVAIERANRRQLARAVRDFRPDVVSAWAMGALSLGLLTWVERAGIPVVSVVCDEWPVYGPHVDAWSDLLVARPVAGRVLGALLGVPGRLPDLDATSATCFVSGAVRDAARRGSPWSFPHSAVVPSGIDRSEMAPAEDAGRRPWRWRLLHVGRLDPRKGVHVAIEALAACPPDATLDVLGTGDRQYLEELQRLTGRLGLEERVRFGAVERAELAARYRAADVLVFSPLWDEPFGLVPLEAMSCGTPVVASPTGGSTEFLVAGTNCVGFRPERPDELAAALIGLAADTALRRAIVEGGLATAARYDADVLARELEGWHRRAAPHR